MTVKHSAKLAVETLMSTELNSLGIGGLKISASPFSNDAAGELELYADFRLYLATQASARSAGANVTMWILPEVDGTFPYGGDSLEPQGELIVQSFTFDAAVTARYAVIRDVPLPPSDYYILLKNNTGQAFAAANNTLVGERHSINPSA
jgi:hypothetical protein